MGINGLVQEPSLRRPNARTELDYTLLETAEELANEGRNVEALTKVFEHLLPEQPPPDFARGPLSFIQGSSSVTAAVHGDDVVITVPLVKLTSDGKAIAALRYILTKIAATGQLYQPRLHGDEVRLEFREPLSRFHPAKVLEVARRMPWEADENDDILMQEFGAQPLSRAPITPLSSQELARAELLWAQHWNDVEELLKECQRKRSIWFLNEVTSYAKQRICFLLPLGGALLSKLEQANSVFNNCDNDPTNRETVLAKCIKDMRALASQALHQSLGHATYAISPYRRGKSEDLLGLLGDGSYLTNVENLRTTGKPFDAALSLISTYNFLLARFVWSDDIYQLLTEGLARVSGKPWREAADILSEHAKVVAAKMEEESDDDEEGDDDDDDSDDEEEDEDDE